MLKTKYKNLILLLTLIVTASMLFAGCLPEDISDSGKRDAKPASNGGKLSEDEVEELIGKDYDNGIMFDEETEGYEVKAERRPVTDFIGSWEVTSGQALYLLGNLDLKIKANGTWKGNVAGSDISGTWAEQDGGIYLKCSDPKKNFDGLLVFTPEGTLVFSYYPLESSTEPNNVVLTRK